MFKKKKKIEEEALGEEVALGSVGGEMDKLIRFTELGGLRACDKVVYINPRYVVEVEEGYTSNQTEITTTNRCIAIKGDLETVINKLNGSYKLPKE